MFIKIIRNGGDSVFRTTLLGSFFFCIGTVTSFSGHAQTGDESSSSPPSSRDEVILLNTNSVPDVLEHLFEANSHFAFADLASLGVKPLNPDEIRMIKLENSLSPPGEFLLQFPTEPINTPPGKGPSIALLDQIERKGLNLSKLLQSGMSLEVIQEFDLKNLVQPSSTILPHTYLFRPKPKSALLNLVRDLVLVGGKYRYRLTHYSLANGAKRILVRLADWSNYSRIEIKVIKLNDLVQRGFSLEKIRAEVLNSHGREPQLEKHFLMPPDTLSSPTDLDPVKLMETPGTLYLIQHSAPPLRERVYALGMKMRKPCRVAFFKMASFIFPGMNP